MFRDSNKKLINLDILYHIHLLENNSLIANLIELYEDDKNLYFIQEYKINFIKVL